jgi:predicted transcriptional regulator
MAKICVILPDEVKEEIDKVAKEQDRNLSWIVRKAIEEYLAAQDKKEE